MSDPTGPLTVIGLKAENVKRLRAIDLTPDPTGVVVLSGRNGQGKSSCIDTLWLLFGGSPAAKANPRPVRDGQDGATATVDLGELIVTRTWKADGTSSLKVESPDGARFPSPQAMLDRLVGRMSFDPLAFTQLPPKDQRRELLKLVELTDGDGKPIDLDKMRGLRATWYADRTEVGRDVRKYADQLTGYDAPPDGLPEQEVSIGDLLAEASAAREQQHAHERASAVVRDRQEDMDLWAAQVAEHEKALSNARKQFAASTKQKDAAVLAREALPDPPNVEAIEQQISTVEQTNRLVRHEQTRQRVHADWAKAKAHHDELEQQIADLDETVAAALSRADLPLAGLSIADDAVLFGTVPLQQASSAEQLRVSVAVAMALNPTVRVLSIREGSLLDSKSMALIAEMAADQGYQVWLELVDESGQVGIVIEDGQVAEQEVKL